VSTITDGVTTITVPILDGFEGSAPARTLVRTSLSGEESVTLRPAGPRSGVLSCVMAAEDDALSLHAMARSASVLNLATSLPASVDMAFVMSGGDVSIALDAARAAWVVSIPFVEVS